MPEKAREQAQLLTRGTLAAQVGCTIETIRYYERIGILPRAPRSAGGHRLFGEDLVKRLHFVRRSRELGFTLEEVRELLRLVDSRAYTCARVETLARAHARDIRNKIADLDRLTAVLDTMASQCSGGDIPECPIIEALFDTRVPPPSPSASARRSRPSRRG